MTTQKRAAVGGEVGANGEFYEGGKFIATKDNPKSSPAERTPAQLMAEQEREARKAHLEAWLSSRRAEMATAIAALLAHGSPDDIFEGFYPSLGRQLSECGSLSPRQAKFAAKGVLGRQTKRNADEFDALAEAMTAEYPGYEAKQ